MRHYCGVGLGRGRRDGSWGSCGEEEGGDCGDGRYDGYVEYHVRNVGRLVDEERADQLANGTAERVG